MNYSKYDTVIIEGPDRVGKDTQIQKIRNHFNGSLWQVLHYSKPPKLETDKDYIGYQSSLFSQMFALASFIPNLILNRSHIGEAVYATYRGYNGAYVFDIEEQWLDKETDERTVVIVLIPKADQLIARNDGESFYTNLEEAEGEIGRFIAAYQVTKFTNKHIIVVDGKSIDEVADEIRAILT